MIFLLIFDTDDESFARELQNRIDRQSREDEDLARALQEAEDRSSILHAIGIPQALATSRGFPFGLGNPFQFNSPMNWFSPNRGIPRMMVEFGRKSLYLSE